MNEIQRALSRTRRQYIRPDYPLTSKVEPTRVTNLMILNELKSCSLGVGPKRGRFRRPSAEAMKGLECGLECSEALPCFGVGLQVVTPLASVRNANLSQCFGTDPAIRFTIAFRNMF